VLDRGATYIERLSVRGRRELDAARRLRLEQRLGNLDLAPSGLPPAALLFVRRVPDPLPRGLSSRVSARVSPSWERAVCERLDQDYRNAARPVRGRVPADAASVLLADESELIACLALALARGELAAHWCWTLALRRYAGSGRARIDALLAANVRLLPAVMAHLALWKRCASVVAVLQGGALDDLVRALSVEHALDVDIEPIEGVEITGDAVTAPLGTGGRPDPVPAPWRKWLGPSHNDQLDPHAERFVGLALMLHCQPAQARSPLFRAQVRAWWQARSASSADQAEADLIEMGASPRSGRGERPLLGSAAGDARFEAPSESTATPAVAPAQRSAPVLDRTLLSAGPKWGQSDPDGDETPVRTSEHTSTTEHSEPLGAAVESGNLPLSDRAMEPVSDAIDKCDRTAASPDRVLETVEDWGVSGVATRLGGALYLINLMRHLELPGCFEPSWGLSRDLGPGGLLELIARALLADEHDDYATDPLWRVLAELDGRAPRQWPGEAVNDNDVYRVPEQWLDEPPERLHWGATDRRLRLWSGRGFLIADVPRGARTASVQAMTEAGRYPGSPVPTQAPFDAAPSDSLHQPLRDDINPSMAFWLRSVMPYLRWRLDQSASAPLDPLDDLLLVPGRLYVTRAHIDLVTSLERISLPARLAGLDRDPGWLGDWGRVVSFHFQ